MKDIGIGLVGSGYMGRCHANAFRTVTGIFDVPLRPVLKVLADETEEMAIKAAASLQFERSTGNWEDLMTDGEVGLVDICTPNDLHKPIALAAIAAGKPVYCEKPIAGSLSDAYEMMNAAEKAGIPTFVGYNYLQNPMIRTVHDIIQSGEIGEVIGFRGIHAEDYMADSTIPYNFRFNADNGGGVLVDLGSHIIALARYLVGAIESVQGIMETIHAERRVAPNSTQTRSITVDDQTRFLARFANGSSGTLEASWVAVGRKMQLAFEISGTKGSLAFTQERLNELKLFEAGQAKGRQGFKIIEAGPDHEGYTPFCPAPGHQLGFNELKVIEVSKVLKAFTCKENACPNFREGWEVQRVLEAVKQSALENRWIHIMELK